MDNGGDKMQLKQELVLDLAGVLVTNFSPLYWRYLSTTFNISYSELTSFKKEIREQLWTGKIPEIEFWTKLKQNFPTIDQEEAKETLRSYIKPLPSLERIPFWSQHANIHIVSNHRIEWINHIIAPIQHHLKSMTISSEIGFCKPQVDIYLEVQNYFHHNHHVLFVDDQEKNFDEARKLGWNTLLADVDGKWVRKVKLG